MKTILQNLRAKIAAMKATPIFNKAAIAEQVMDDVLKVLEALQFEIEDLRKEVKQLKGG